MHLRRRVAVAITACALIFGANLAVGEAGAESGERGVRGRDIVVARDDLACEGFLGGLGMACAESMVGPFWAMATSRMAGLSAAAGIAVINSLANLGGYFGPDIIGFFRKLNGGFRGGLLAIGATLAVSGAVALIVGRTSLVRASEE